MNDATINGKDIIISVFILPLLKFAYPMVQDSCLQETHKFTALLTKKKV